MHSYNNNAKIIPIMIWPFVGVHYAGKPELCFHLITVCLVPHRCPELPLNHECRLSQRCFDIKAPPLQEVCFFLVCWLHSQNNFTQLQSFISAKFSCFWANWSSRAARAELYNHAGHRARGISSHNHRENSQKKSASVGKLTPQPAEHSCRRIHDAYLHSAPLHEANVNLQISW